MKEIFAEIIVSLLKILDEEFKVCMLNIKRLEGNVGFSGYYVDLLDEKHPLNVFDFELDSSVIHSLYFETQNSDMSHINWNRAIFTLLPYNKFEIEYQWDQGLQDEVDSYNK